MLRTLCGAVLAGLLAMPAVAPAYEAGPVADGGTVSGKVLFKGAAPAPRKMLITKNTEVCGTGEREIVEVAVKNGALANAAVVVEGIARGKPWGAQLQKPLLDQKGCRFLPPMLLVPKGGELDIQNSDPVLHNIHSYEIIGTARRTLFNFGQPNQGQRLSKPVNVRRGELIKLECDAHDFMHAWMFATPSPYATLSGEDGAFRLGEVPPGTYKIRAVHPVLGVREAQVTVPAKGTAEVTFTFEAR